MNTENTSTPPSPASSTDYRAIRIENMRKLEAAGYKPFGQAFERTGPIAEIRAGWTPPAPAADAAAAPETPPAPPVRAAGRMMARRIMSKSIFLDLADGTGRIQIFCNSANMGAEPYEAVRELDLGDHIGVEGDLFLTRTGELSIRVTGWTLLSKALRQPPEKFHGLQDTEDRYRMRYLDLMANPESRDRFNKRIAIIRSIRRYLEDRGFQEVETPMMQPQPGGAAARPFMTHYNALDCTMYMRIAPELYLKRLLVGGFDKIFEIGRNFRNEGLDRSHNPEFTVMELYQAYGDRHAMKALLEGFIPHACEEVLGTVHVPYGEQEIDFTPPYREVSYPQLIREKMGDDWFDLPLEEAQKRAAEAGLDVNPAWSMLELSHEVYDKLIERTLFQPCFVVDIPREYIPLAKTRPDNPDVADAFEFVVAGRELCPGYTEQNDPLAQRTAFEHQAGEDTEKIDEDFIRALEYGMPPAGGMGIGIDRLVMLLTGTEVIRDVILFPQLKQ